MYSCQSCDKSFATSRGLQWHIDSIHKGVRYPCKLCGKVFKQQNNLNNHTRLHTAELPFVCQICNKSYVAKKNLDRHLLTHLDDKDKKYLCPLCDMRFHENCALKRHMKTHSDKRSYSCNICSKRFKQSSNLNQHQLTHADVRKFSCNNCNASFKLMSHLQSHLTSHSEQVFKCTKCEKPFRSMIHVRAHFNLVHVKKEKRNVCVFWNKSFFKWGHLKRHIQKHIHVSYVDKHSWKNMLCLIIWEYTIHVRSHTNVTPVKQISFQVSSLPSILQGNTWRYYVTSALFVLKVFAQSKNSKVTMEEYIVQKVNIDINVGGVGSDF